MCVCACVRVILASPTYHCPDSGAGYGSPAWRPRAVKVRVRFGTGDRPIGETGCRLNGVHPAAMSVEETMLVAPDSRVCGGSGAVRTCNQTYGTCSTFTTIEIDQSIVQEGNDNRPVAT